MAGIEDAKRAAGYAAVDEWVEPWMTSIGIGSGTTVIYAVERLAQKVKENNMKVVCVPTGYQARELMLQYDLPLSDLSTVPNLDIDIDGADEVDCNLNLIKGGGGCHLQEKILAFNAKKFIIVADHRKDSQYLGQQWKQGVPLEVLPMAHIPVMKTIEEYGGKATIRRGTGKTGPTVSDNGNFLIDADFGVITDPATLDNKLRTIPGVVGTGLFVGMADMAYIGNADGTLVKRARK